MKIPARSSVLSAALALALAAIIGPIDPAPATAAELRSACRMIPAAEMSALLGVAVTATGDDRGGQTKCTYETPQPFGPSLEVMLSWDGGEAGMAGAGIAGRQMGPGSVNPYAGLGDQAVSVGPMLMIRRGEDLVTLTFGSIDDVPAKARAIYRLLDQRIGAKP